MVRILEFIVSKCLAKDREDRYGFAQETAKDLRTLGEKLKSGRSTILRACVIPPPQARSTTTKSMPRAAIML